MFSGQEIWCSREPHKLQAVGPIPTSATTLEDSMSKRRGYIQEINGSYFWYDVNDNAHRLDEMDESYLNNCIKLLDKRKQDSIKKNVKFDQDLDRFHLEDELKHRELVKNTSVGRLIYA